VSELKDCAALQILTARQQAVAMQRLGPGSSNDTGDFFPIRRSGSNAQSSDSDDDADVSCSLGSIPFVPPRLTRAAAAAAAAAAVAAAAATTVAQSSESTEDVPSPSAALPGVSRPSAEHAMLAAVAVLGSEGEPPLIYAATEAPSAPDQQTSNARQCERTNTADTPAAHSGDRQTGPPNVESDSMARPQQLPERFSQAGCAPIQQPAGIPAHISARHCHSSTETTAAVEKPLLCMDRGTGCQPPGDPVTHDAFAAQPSRSSSSHHTPFGATATTGAEANEDAEVVSPPPGGWKARGMISVPSPGGTAPIIIILSGSSSIDGEQEGWQRASGCCGKYDTHRRWCLAPK
jgi:hypothetical protein